MRYGIFSDIHSNLEALEAVIKAYQKEKIDQYLCLGDVVGYGANPNECVELTANMAAMTVAGNHDWAALGLFPAELFNEEAEAAVLWTGKELSGASKSFLRGLKLVGETDNFILTHGSLNAPHDFNYLQNIRDCQPTFQLMKQNICFVGHTHVPVVFIRDEQDKIHYEDTLKIRVEPGNKYIVNVGSVGQPRDSIPAAAFCIWDSEKNEVEIKRAVYDVFTARQKIIDKGLPEFLGNRLLSGN
jgi:predicted phosphodiesterase